MTPHYADALVTLYLGDCVQVMAELPPDSVDAIVTDPPYGLEFMGKEWDRLTSIDSQVGSTDGVSVGGRSITRSPKTSPAADVRQPGDPTFHKSGSGPHDRSTVRYGYGVPMARMQVWHEAWAREAFRVAKPGAHLLAFGGTRTYHRLASAIEDAGWEIRDCLVWAYASGFPKSLNLTGEHAGWGTALKPAWEPIVLARKPLRGTVAGNVQQYGTGALNIDGTRIGTGGDKGEWPITDRPVTDGVYGDFVAPALTDNGKGRWPANLLLTATEWYTLRHDVGQEVRDLILAYFEAQGMGADELPNMRQGVRDHAGMGEGRAAQVLLPSMQLEGVAQGEAGGGPAHRGVQAEDAGQRPEADGAEVARLEGRTLPRSARVRLGGSLDADGQGAGAGRGDGSEAPQGAPIRSGAPASDGDHAGSPARTARGGSPSERGQGRQPTSQPVPAGSVEPHAGASDGGPGAGPVAGPSDRARSRERGLTVPLALIPRGWLPYFEFSHDTGVFDGGVEGVVGGGTVSDPKPERVGLRGGTAWQGQDGFGSPDKEGRWPADPGGTYSRFFLVPKSSRSDREPLTRDEAYRLHRERGDCDKLPAWRRPDPSPSEPTDSTSPARATSDEPSMGSSSSATSSPGSQLSDPSSRATKSTTSTATSRTTGSRTFNSSIRSPTSASTLDAFGSPVGSAERAGAQTVNGTSLAESAESSSPSEPLTGTSPERDGRSTADADPAISARWSSRSSCGDCGKPLPRVSTHPTQKPTALMRHLVRLVTPPGGTVLDCFLGSGTTAIAANAEGFRCIGIEREAEYLDIAVARLAHQPLGLGLDVAAPTRKGLGRSSGHYNKGSRSVGAKVGPASIPIDGLRSRTYDD